MRLRPSGNKGPAAVSLASFRRYHAGEAWTWERLALTRARVIAGPAPLREQIEGVIRSTLARKTDDRQLRHEVRAMREKLGAQFPARDRWDLKFAPGGLVDIEFCVQYLELFHGWESPEILCQNTVSAIEQLSAHEFLAASDAANLLAAAHLQLALLQLLRIATVGPFDSATANEGMKLLLARAGEKENFGVLETHLADAQCRARAVFEKLFYE